MKTIGIDARLISQTGVGVYIANLIHCLQKIPGGSKYRFLIYLMEEEYEKLEFNMPNFVKKRANFRWHTITEQIGFYPMLIKDEPDLVHFTYFSYPVFYRKPFVATIHDSTPLLFKTGKASTQNRLIYHFKHTVFSYVLKTQIVNATVIITPSKTVKKQLLQIFGEKNANKIHTTYEGIDYRLQNTAPTDLSGQFGQDFFLYVGNFYPHKNVANLIKAFAPIKTAAKLILAGPKDFFSNRMLNLISQLKLENKIVLYHNKSHQELVYFYTHAKALIFPSLSEGFGLPIAEAAYFGLPIIASDIPVFQEFLGNEYCVFNPYDINDIKQTIENFLAKEPVEKPNYSALLSKLSFEKMAQDTLSLYEWALEKNS